LPQATVRAASTYSANRTMTSLSTGANEQELRRDPDQHQIWTFSEYRKHYAAEYTEQDIFDYWRKCCRPIKSEAPAYVQQDRNNVKWTYHEESCQQWPPVVLELKLEPPEPEAPEVQCFAGDVEAHANSPPWTTFDFDAEEEQQEELVSKFVTPYRDSESEDEVAYEVKFCDEERFLEEQQQANDWVSNMVTDAIMTEVQRQKTLMRMQAMMALKLWSRFTRTRCPWKDLINKISSCSESMLQTRCQMLLKQMSRDRKINMLS